MMEIYGNSEDKKLETLTPLPASPYFLVDVVISVLCNLHSRHDFGKKVLSIFLVKIIAAILSDNQLF